MQTEEQRHKKRKKTVVLLAVICGVLLAGCLSCFAIGSFAPDEPTVTPTIAVVATAAPVNTTIPSSTPTDVPASTPTPRPTWTSYPTYTPQSTPTPAFEQAQAQVIRVVDGDTIKVDVEGTIYTVRYIGIDTPETVHPSKPVQWMGPEASEANRQLVGDQTVYLEKDVSETDRYGRLLRYVFLADGLFVNAELVRLGYAQVSTYPPDVRYQDLFLEMQQEAREAENGLWGSTPTSPPATTAVPVAQPTQPPSATVCDCSGNIYNCSDFATHAQAQGCYDYCMSRGRGDIHELDADDDGIACESLP